MHDLQQGVRRQVQLASAHPDALQHQATRVRPLRQSVRAQVVPVQARGIVLHALAKERLAQTAEAEPEPADERDRREAEVRRGRERSRQGGHQDVRHIAQSRALGHEEGQLRSQRSQQVVGLHQAAQPRPQPCRSLMPLPRETDFLLNYLITYLLIYLFTFELEDLIDVDATEQFVNRHVFI